MKQKTTFAICAVLLLAGFFGLQAVSESGIPFWGAIVAILGIIAAEVPVIVVVNKNVGKEGAR